MGITSMASTVKIDTPMHPMRFPRLAGGTGWMLLPAGGD
jgi:hypothetical protein